MTLIGLISDTHGLVRPEVAAALAGVCRIVHAGDIGKPEVLGTLSAIAPVTAVRGNVDHGPWTAALPADAVVSVDGHGIYVMHNLNDLEIDLQGGWNNRRHLRPHARASYRRSRRRSLYQSRQRRPAPLFPAHLDWVSAARRRRGPRGVAANHRGLEPVMRRIARPPRPQSGARQSRRAFPLPWGEGQGEGRFPRSPHHPA